MPELTDLRRRSFLVGVAAAVGAAALAACGDDGPDGQEPGTGDSAGAATKGSATEPLPAPAAFQQAPTIDAGLPPVEDRVGEAYVVPHHWITQGTYGGDLKLAISSSDDAGIGELWYSFSMLRFLNDGQLVGPGLVTKWSSNDDASEWTFTMRKVNWSDGTPVTTADVMFWWNDMINFEAYPESAPDECKSAKGTICEITATDDHTFTMTFDSPSPLTADRVAMWTSGYGGNGPVWIVPAHYAKKFHPKYTKSTPKDWTDVGGSWQKNMSYRISTEVPTLLPYRLVKFSDGRQLVWERNPYCYEVTKDGDQLPYIDGILMTVVEDPQVRKVQVGKGQVDYMHGALYGLTLADYSTLRQQAEDSAQEIYLWDSGSGTGSIFFFNYDYEDKKYRDLFREPRFRQALSLAFDRATAKKTIYYEQGEITTGTMSPKAIEFSTGDEGVKSYESWRDAYATYDPDRAGSLLDELGLKQGAGGMRTFPDGSTLQLRIDRPGNAGTEQVQKDAQLVRDWKRVGIDISINPVPPVSFADFWKSGKYMAQTNDEVSDGPNCLLYPQWIVPMDNSHWAPLEGEMYYEKGTAGYTSEQDVDPWKRKPPRLMPEEGGPVEKLWNLYESTKAEPDMMKRTRTVWELVKVHVEDGPFFMGPVANFPQIVVKKTALKNLPARDSLYLGGFVNPWIHPTPAVYDIEALYWEDPENHEVI